MDGRVGCGGSMDGGGAVGGGLVGGGKVALGVTVGVEILVGAGVSVAVGGGVGVKVAVGGRGVGVGVKVGTGVGGLSLTMAGSAALNSGNGSHSGRVLRMAATMTTKTSTTNPLRIRACTSRADMLRDYRVGWSECQRG